MAKHLSNSSEQQEAERSMLISLQEKLGLNFDSKFVLPIDIGIQPDAIDPIKKVVVEVYARIGVLKGGQNHKVKGDILKLALIGKRLGPRWRKIMCFASNDAAQYAQGKSWVAEAAKEFKVEVHVVRLSKDQRNKVVSAQNRQQMVNPKC